MSRNDRSVAVVAYAMHSKRAVCHLHKRKPAGVASSWTCHPGKQISVMNMHTPI
jgi:hypothetical protein